MYFSQKKLSPQFIEQLKKYVYDIVGHLIDVYKKLPCGLPEYIYQEALDITLSENGVPHKKEYKHNPEFNGKRLESYLKMDFIVERECGNIIIECKAIDKLGDKERHQIFSYMIGSQFPIGILVNFGTYPQAQIEKYYFDRQDGSITPF